MALLSYWLSIIAMCLEATFTFTNYWTVVTPIFIIFGANQLKLNFFVFGVELVSKELNHFGGIVSFFRDWAPGTLTGGA